LKNHQVDAVIDAVRSGKGLTAPGENIAGIRRLYGPEETMPDDYDVVFITNPTHLHRETLIAHGKRARHFFVEKPVFTPEQADLPLPALPEGQQVYVACPLRYSGVLRYLKTAVDLTKVIHIRAICSSYLPDWRPEADYRKCYSASQNLGGGVSADLIHEMDYLCHLFGAPTALHRIAAKVSALEMDSEDIALYIGRYPAKTMELHLNYFGRKVDRRLQLFLNDEVVTADFIAGRVEFAQRGESVLIEETRNAMYEREMEGFFELCAGRAENENDLEAAVRTLHLAMGEVK
jgi:predicted dehydrogenase